MTSCPWCASTDDENPDFARMCRLHLAEWEGVSVTELDRMESEQLRKLEDYYS
jgi:hypothetical protein